MPRFYVVVDELKDWSPYYPSQDVVTFEHYLNEGGKPTNDRVRVINLCRNYRYLGTAYYCALLAEARGHHVFPAVRTLNDMASRSLSSLQLDGMESLLHKIRLKGGETSYVFRTWFGNCLDPALAPLAKSVFERFPCPLIEITLEYRQQGWSIRKLQPVSLKALKSAEEQEAFANAFEQFSNRLWRQPRARKAYRFDLAILVDPQEAMPPSDKVAIRKFIHAAEQLGIAAEMITRKDYLRLPEYDGLFIRETTALGHHTYSFAKKAEAEGMVVIDDPTSILRCTNKVYMAELLKHNKVPTPGTELLSSNDPEKLQAVVDKLGFPLVLKVPDGAFSRGVVKVENWDQLVQESTSLLKKSALLLVQEYMYTNYDWRIGVLNNKPLFACRYYMVRNHWQIYRHGGGQVKSGGFDAMPTYEAPKKVIDVAVKAAGLIGNGLYGVDVKQSDDRVVVIEINDNPNIDSAVEDKYLGNQLYTMIMEEFLRRMEAKRR